MKTNWQTKKLGEVCTIRPHKKETEKLNQFDLVSFVPMEDLPFFGRYLHPQKRRHLDEVLGSYTYFANGDVLLAKVTPCFENGKLSIAENLENGVGFGSSEFIVFRSHENLYPAFLFYFLSTFDFRESGKKRMIGTSGLKRLSKEFVENYEIPLPPLPEQRRIVAILDEVFLATSTAKENTGKNLKNSHALFESYLQDIFANPKEDWEEKTLGELGQITSSKRIFKKEYVSSGVPFYRIKEVKELANDKEISTELFITNKRYDEIKKVFGVPKEGDLLMTAVGTIGEIYVVKKDEVFYFKDGNVLWFKNFDSINSDFLKLVLRSFVENIKRLSIGSAYNALTIEKIENYKIFVPSLPEQKAIVARLDALSGETKKLEEIYRQKIADVEELKKSVLKSAFAMT